MNSQLSRDLNLRLKVTHTYTHTTSENIENIAKAIQFINPRTDFLKTPDAQAKEVKKNIISS